MSERRIIVIGAGVSGLTTAHELTDRGLKVVVITQHDATKTVSVVAGALWEWPPAVCGHHNDVVSLSRSKDWCKASYLRFQDLAKEPATGVSLRRSTFYFETRVQENARELEKMCELQPHVRDFVHGAGLIAENSVNLNLGLIDAYSYTAPTIETSQYTHWLRSELESQAVPFVTRHIASDLRQHADDLLREFQADAIINCAGLGGRNTASDPTLFPLRGALVRLINDGSRGPKIDACHCITHTEDNLRQNMIYLVPRGDHLLLGGIAERDEIDTSIDLENSQEVRDIVERCFDFMPRLRDYEIDQSCPVMVGLRPARTANVRLERESDLPIVHNYGHGGSGFTLSWGCAEEVADLIGATHATLA